MKKKLLSAMMVLSLTAACLAGCGNKKAETEAPKATEAVAETETVTEAAAETEAVTEAAAETEAATEAAEEVTEAATEAAEEVTEAATEAAEEETEAVTEAAAEEVTEAATEAAEEETEAVTEAAAEEVTEAATEAAEEETEAVTEAAAEEVTEEATEAAEEETEAVTEAATEEVTEAATEAAEEVTEAATEEATEEVTEAATEEATEEVTEAAEEETEAVTEAAAEETTEEVTEAVTEEATEEVTEAATEEVTEAATEEATEEVTEEVTEAATEEATEEVTEAATEEATEEVTEAATEEATEEVTEAATEEVTEEVTEAATEAAEEETEAAETAEPVGTIKIGLFQPLTGQNGGGGVQEAQGAWYANEVRPTVTIDGDVYTVELDEVDNKSDKTEAVTAAQKLVSDGVVAVIGSYGSGVSIAAGPIFADAKIPAIGCSCTNPQVTSGCEYYFRVCFLDPFQGSVMAKYAKEQGYENVAVIEELGDDYSTGIANFFIKAFTEEGGTIAGGKAQDFQTNQSDFKAILTQVKDADAIFAPSSITTASLIIKQARELGIEAPIMGPDTWFNVAVIENAGDSAEGIVASTFFAEDDTTIDGLDEFVDGYKAWMNADASRIEKNGGNDDVVGNSALCYDTYMVICDALEAAGTTDGEALKAAIAETDYNGATGHIVFDEIGDAARDSVTVVVAKDGKFQFLEKVMAD